MQSPPPPPSAGRPQSLAHAELLSQPTCPAHVARLVSARGSPPRSATAHGGATPASTVVRVTCYVGSVAHAPAQSTLETLARCLIVVEPSTGVIVATYEVPEAIVWTARQLFAFAAGRLAARQFWTDVHIEPDKVVFAAGDGGDAAAGDDGEVEAATTTTTTTTTTSATTTPPTAGPAAAPATTTTAGTRTATRRTSFFLPGFVDGHTHAPQYEFAGLGTGMPLLEWLTTYTFPVEAQLHDVALARDVYTRAVQRHLSCGTTTCSYFATLHVDSTKVLVDVVRRAGQRAHVGLVSMDRNSPDNYVRSTDDSLADARAFLLHMAAEEEAQEKAEEGDEGSSSSSSALPSSPSSSLVKAVVTPRFVPSCTPRLMRGLGDLAAEFQVPVQSHLSETRAECAWVHDLHPKASCYAAVYRRHGLLCTPGRGLGPRVDAGGGGSGDGGGAATAAAAAVDGNNDGGDAKRLRPSSPPAASATCVPCVAAGTAATTTTTTTTIKNHRYKAYMAHCCQSGPLERGILRDSSVGVIHCPNSNFSLGSGVLDVRQMWRDGVVVGLGTDVAGGYSASMLDAMRQARIASSVSAFMRPGGTGDAKVGDALSVAEMLFLATRGGALAMGLQVGWTAARAADAVASAAAVAASAGFPMLLIAVDCC
jgi:cytosine/adenosine deaminase-related metal-dependent hydrolase